ncbi:MAG: type II toxin-antitoxin system VapC family toxin [Timaviella obliquedivisa GSE-PSE-MK23-08B]|jgi:PIN domain nuclease of toxin-antitoxin system|nr:type II toxin-antitoxin system VapC family toxin [Timaviella obliquedivisa GSE-PSE-MK23-08B]
MSEIIVLDTHIWLWLINANFDQFPSRWLDSIKAAACVGVSPISCYEIALAHKKGRIRLPSTAQDWFREALTPAGVEVLPMTEAIAARAVDLSPTHKDPFDRLIIATALEYGAKLASVDRSFAQYSELETCLLK